MAAKAAYGAGPQAPPFLTSAGTPLTAPGLAALMRTALDLAGRDTRARKITVHSLRRSGACSAAGGGSAHSDVMTHGTWRGDSVDAYVPRTLFSSVPQTIKNILGSNTSVH